MPSCGYTWEEDMPTHDNDCGNEHECILQSGDDHTEHECACGEAQSED